MIITRTPYRLSLFGGGTDYPEWFKDHGGQVLAGAIDKYCYLTLRWLPPFFEHRYRIVYSQVESVQSADQIQHPAVRAAIQYFGIDRGIELHHDGDLPARSGIGSSAAFSVGLIRALRELKDLPCDGWEIAQEAIYLEQNLLQETGGVQDQLTCALGGFHHLTFDVTGAIASQRSEKLVANSRKLQDWLVLLYSGSQRSSHEVSQPLISALQTQKALLKRTGEMVTEGRCLIESGTDNDFEGVGHLLHESWLAKGQLNPLSVTPRLQYIYDQAIESGALGGKVSGAGGGGFMLFCVPPDRRASFLSEISAHAVHVPFRFAQDGSRTIFHDMKAMRSADEGAKVQ